MTRFLDVEQVKHLHTLVLEQSGGSAGLRDEGGLESAVAQPQASFGGTDLYPSLAEKAAALAYALVQNHAFVDGNKRIGHAAMEVFLLVNDHPQRGWLRCHCSRRPLKGVRALTRTGRSHPALAPACAPLPPGTGHSAG